MGGCDQATDALGIRSPLGSGGVTLWNGYVPTTSSPARDTPGPTRSTLGAVFEYFTMWVSMTSETLQSSVVPGEYSSFKFVIKLRRIILLKV